MQHITTRTPPHISFDVHPSPYAGYLATALNAHTQRRAQVWGPTEIDARQRAEMLVDMPEPA